MGANGSGWMGIGSWRQRTGIQGPEHNRLNMMIIVSHAERNFANWTPLKAGHDRSPFVGKNTFRAFSPH